MAMRESKFQGAYNMVFSDYTSSFAANGSTHGGVRINRLPDGLVDASEKLPFHARVLLSRPVPGFTLREIPMGPYWFPTFPPGC